jgi:hypothetical protein
LVIRKYKKKGGRRIENATCNAHHYVYHHPLKDHTMNQWLVPILFRKELFVYEFLGRERSRNEIFGL